ncbi:ZIP family metal transporter [Chloroflexota bacterium]
MNPVVLTLVGLLAGAATGVGGALGVFFRPSERNLVLGLSLSSGIMLGVTFLILVPESLKTGFYPSFVGFVIGSLLFFLLECILPHIHIGESRNSLPRLGTLIAIGIAIHDIPEGFGIGSGYGISESFGGTIAIAIILHNLPEGMAVAIPFHFSGMGKFRTVLISFAAGISTLVGTLAAFFLLGSFSEKLIHSGLAFAAGAMFYITVNELIPEAHKYGHTHLVGPGVLAGILVAFLLTLMGA